MPVEYTYHDTIWRFGTIAKMPLSCDGNQLQKVTGQCADLICVVAMDFKNGANKAAEHRWDANGNITRNRNKNNNS